MLAVPLPARVLVTGATSGIGRAVAELFLASGSTVGLVGSRPSSVDAALEALGRPDTATGLVADQRDPAALRRAVDAFADDGLDAVVCAAGIEGDMGATVETVAPATMRDVLDVNVVGTFAVVQAATPHLARSASPSVTLIGSDSGFVAARDMLAYNASKGALVQLVRALALELFDDHGIRVNSVCPSITDTPMAHRGLGDAFFDDATVPVCRPEDIAYAVASLATPLARAVNGVNLLADFGYHGRSSFPA